MPVNQHGLNRNIPAEVKRAVRQRCGFGCARCGATIYEYEHFFPDFRDATKHNAASIVLLCPNCHGLATKGLLPKQQVAEFSQSPAAVKSGFSSLSLPFFKGIPSLRMGGGALVHQTPIPLQVKGRSLISFLPPEDGSEITQISFLAADAAGSNFLEVKDNEWRVRTGNWDFEWIGQRYIFKTSKGEPMLILRMQPPDFISIEIFRTSIDGIPIEITESKLQLGGMTLTGNVMSHCQIGLSIG